MAGQDMSFLLHANASKSLVGDFDDIIRFSGQYSLKRTRTFNEVTRDTTAMNITIFTIQYQIHIAHTNNDLTLQRIIHNQ